VVSKYRGFAIRSIQSEICVHRVGGGGPKNLELKPQESKLDPPGISVLIGGTPGETAADFRRVFGPRSSIGQAAKTVGTAQIDQIRALGFDVVSVPTDNFPNHGRIVHPNDRASGFNQENLQKLSRLFTDTIGL
jgi:hypothetical protein